MNNNEGNNSNYSRMRKKKDPKSMTIEELEDYIKRNRSNASKTSVESKSLNNSFQCLNSFNFIDNNSASNTNSNMNTTSNLVSHHKKEKSEERINMSFNSIHNKTDSNEGSELRGVKAKALFKELSSPYNINHNSIKNNKKTNKEQIDQFEEKKNESSQSSKIINTSSITALSPTSGETETKTNPITNLNSKAASYYLKTLQDKISQLTQENDELKRNFISISELYEKEKEKNNKMLYYESNNNNNTINKSTESLTQLNTQEKEELLLKINMQTTNIALLEKEKMRHLEQNSIEKTEYENRIEQLNKKMQSLIKENETSKRELIQLREIKDEFDKFKKQFEEERSEMIDTMKSLREIIFQKENEKNTFAKQYDIMIQELNDKIEQLTYSNNGNSSQMNHSNTFTSTKKSKTSYNNTPTVNIKPRNKTKEKQQIPTKLNSNNNQSSSSSVPMNANKKPKRQKTPKRKNSKQHQKTSIPIKSMINSNKLNQLKYQNQMLNDNEMNININMNNQNALFKPGELNSIRSDYEYNNEAYRNNWNSWQSKRDERINDYEEQLNQINESIFALERNLPEITRNYKNILSRLNSNLFPEETVTLKNNLNVLGATIEEHNNQLMQLKSQQQDILKDYLAQRGNLN